MPVAGLRTWLDDILAGFAVMTEGVDAPTDGAEEAPDLGDSRAAIGESCGVLDVICCALRVAVMSDSSTARIDRAPALVTRTTAEL